MKKLSIGTTYEGNRPEFLQQLLSVTDHLEFSPDSLAISTEGMVRVHPEKLQELLNASSDVDLLVHGVGLSIGSADGVSKSYLRLLDELYESLRLRWHSEHLAYTMVEGVNLGTMLTLPRTAESLEMICRRVDMLQNRYAIPFLLENVVSLIPEYYSDYTHADFLNRICARTGCGLILDIYNLECDAYNHGLDIHSFLTELECFNIREFHVASGMLDSGFMTDIHIGRTADSTLYLARMVVEQYGAYNLEAITYELLDEFVERVGVAAIMEELKKLKSIFHEKSAVSEGISA